MLRNRVPKVAKSISRALHLPADLAHRQITPLKSTEISIELEGARLGIAEELALENKTGLVCGCAGPPGVRDVLRIERDGPKDPIHGDTVETQPR
jgi:hypothetical protein